jgi:hypothetical protein
MIEVAPSSDVWMTYNEAVIYCQFLEHNGHTDWRLPTYDEYFTISRESGHDSGVVSVFPWGVGVKWGWWIGREAPYQTLYVFPVRDV